METQFVRQAHALKGGSGMLGATELYRMAAELEAGGLEAAGTAQRKRLTLLMSWPPRATGLSVFLGHVSKRRFPTQLWRYPEMPAKAVNSRQSARKSSPAAPALPSIRIVVADDHPVVRFGVRNMLMNEPGFEVVGEAEDGDDAITQTLELEPDILLLDVLMPRLPGLESMRAIMAKSPRVKIVLLTSTITQQQIIEALQIGARGIVLKDSVAGDLSQALRAVLGGDYWIGGERVANLLKALQGLQAQMEAVPERKTFGLTPRELEVVSCIVEGCSNRDIARQFSISEETVKRHLSNVFDKTGVSTRLELALFAISHKLVEI